MNCIGPIARSRSRPRRARPRSVSGIRIRPPCPSSGSPMIVGHRLPSGPSRAPLACRAPTRPARSRPAWSSSARSCGWSGRAPARRSRTPAWRPPGCRPSAPTCCAQPARASDGRPPITDPVGSPLPGNPPDGQREGRQRPGGQRAGRQAGRHPRRRDPGRRGRGVDSDRAGCADRGRYQQRPAAAVAATSASRKTPGRVSRPLGRRAQARVAWAAAAAARRGGRRTACANCTRRRRAGSDAGTTGISSTVVFAGSAAPVSRRRGRVGARRAGPLRVLGFASSAFAPSASRPRPSRRRPSRPRPSRLSAWRRLRGVGLRAVGLVVSAFGFVFVASAFARPRPSAGLGCLGLGGGRWAGGRGGFGRNLRAGGARVRFGPGGVGRGGLDRWRGRRGGWCCGGRWRGRRARGRPLSQGRRGRGTLRTGSGAAPEPSSGPSSGAAGRSGCSTRVVLAVHHLSSITHAPRTVRSVVPWCHAPVRVPLPRLRRHLRGQPSDGGAGEPASCPQGHADTVKLSPRSRSPAAVAVPAGAAGARRWRLLRRRLRLLIGPNSPPPGGPALPGARSEWHLEAALRPAVLTMRDRFGSQAA